MGGADLKIQCIHGYFKFEETEAGQLSRFMSQFDLEIERSGDHFTFADLVDAPDYALAGGLYLGAAVTQTIEGAPWEIFRANRLVYNFSLGLVQPIDLVLQAVSLTRSGFVFLAPGMILPGSVTEDGSRVTDYAASFNGAKRFDYSEVGYDE